MIVVDNFIKDKILLDELKNEKFWSSMAQLNWWDG